MSFVKNYIGILVMVTMVTSMFGLVIGEGAFKKQAKTILGIIVLIAVIGPISSLPGIISGLEQNVGSLNPPNAGADKSLKFAGQVKEQTEKVFKQQTEEYVEQLLNQEFKLEGTASVTADTDTDGNVKGISKVDVVITGEANKGGIDTIEKIVIGNTEVPTYSGNVTNIAPKLADMLGIEAYQVGVVKK